MHPAAKEADEPKGTLRPAHTPGGRRHMRGGRRCRHSYRRTSGPTGHGVRPSRRSCMTSARRTAPAVTQTDAVWKAASESDAYGNRRPAPAESCERITALRKEYEDARRRKPGGPSHWIKPGRLSGTTRKSCPKIPTAEIGLFRSPLFRAGTLPAVAAFAYTKTREHIYD